MSSSPSDSLPALPAEPRALTSSAAADGFEIRQRGWAKRLLPQTTFGRSLLLIVIPLVLVQMIAAWIFYDRHWETVSYRLSADVAGEIAMVIDAVEPAASDPELSAQLRHASDMTELDFTYRSGAVLLAIATVFLRNQVKSLRRLAAAAEEFGKGRPVSFTKPEGALEVRQAGAAFLRMRERIDRQIRQRTEMLAGVSHDLRTPLTRMKLALALIGEDSAVAELKSDVSEMERLVNLYLDFARGEGTETIVVTDSAPLIEDVAAAAERQGPALTLARIDELVLPVRPNALRRCLSNLIANARHYG